MEGVLDLVSFSPFPAVVRVAEAIPGDDMSNLIAGIGNRFDFHVCKALCELRYVFVLYASGTVPTIAHR